MRHFTKALIATAITLTTLAAPAFAVTDGSYTLTKLDTTLWEGTEASLLKPVTSDYDYLSGDDEYLTYTLPVSWQFKFYGLPYSQITVDTNGNIWFGSARAAYSFPLANAGLGPVSAAFNDDLSSLYGGGAFIQHRTNPERIVIEWQTETMTEEGNSLFNNFEAVLFENGTIRYDYKPSTPKAPRTAAPGFQRTMAQAT